MLLGEALSEATTITVGFAVLIGGAAATAVSSFVLLRNRIMTLESLIGEVKRKIEKDDEDTRAWRNKINTWRTLALAAADDRPISRTRHGSDPG